MFKAKEVQKLSANAAIELKNISKYFGGNAANKNVNLKTEAVKLR